MKEVISINRLLIIVPFLFLLFPITTSAFYINNVNDSASVLDLPPFYFAEKDEIRIKYKGRNVAQVDWHFVADNGRVHEKTLRAPDGYWYVASGFTCIGKYDSNIRDKSGNILATMSITIENGDLASPTCESDGAGETGNEIGEGQACATIICECIEELKIVNEGIKDSVDANGKILEKIEVNTGITNIKLGELNSIAGGILGELQTDDSVKEGKVPEIKIPSVGDRLENNKPDEHPVFKDDTIYFKDEGDAPPVGKMPAVPNIKDWDGLKREDEISVEKEMKKDDEIKKDNEKKKDDELKKDEFEKDDELKKDKFEKDEEIKKDEFKKDDELKKDKFEKDDEFRKDNELDKTHEYERDDELSVTN